MASLETVLTLAGYPVGASVGKDCPSGTLARLSAWLQRVVASFPVVVMTKTELVVVVGRQQRDLEAL